MKKSRLLGAVCACFFCIPSIASAQTYTFTDLGTLGGTLSTALAINNSGQIAGGAWTGGDTSYHATVWNGTTATDLTPGVPGFSSEGAGINTSGQVAGQSVVTLSSGGWAWRASVWNGTALTVLGTLPDTTHNDANDINDSGQVVGRSIIDAFSGVHHATIWNGTTPTDLGANGMALAINNSGQVAGLLNASGSLGAAGTHATIWNGTTATDLGTLGGSQSTAFDINDSGLVVGHSLTIGDANTHATLWGSGGPIDLGTLGGTDSQAHAINDAGTVVGYSRITGNSDTHATLWDGSNTVDLNTLLDANTISDGWILEQAYDINDNGWIVGIAENTITGETHGFLLSTVPIPASLWLFGSGLLGLISVARKKEKKVAIYKCLVRITKGNILANKKTSTIGVVAAVAVLLIVYTQLTIFVVQPIGALPEGKTLIILRLNKGKFIDSADAMCERLQGSVNLICRATMIGAVAKKSTIILRLPYIETLYLISTGGATYGK